jgi:hypothetical protein
MSRVGEKEKKYKTREASVTSSRARDGRREGRRSSSEEVSLLPPLAAERTHVVTHEEVVGVWRVSSNSEELAQIVL